MVIYLPETEYALSACKAHLDAHPDPDSPIGYYLTSYLVVRMCAEMEQAISNLIKQKVNRDAPAVAGFVLSFKRSIVRNASFGELSDKIGLLSGDLKERFQKEVRDSLGEKGITLIGNAVKDRNETGHENPPDLTFSELEETYHAAEKMLEVAASVLG